MHLISGGLLYVATLMSEEYVSEETQSADEDIYTKAFMTRHFVQVFSLYTIGILVSWCLDLRNSFLRNLPLAYAFPMIVRLASLTESPFVSATLLTPAHLLSLSTVAFGIAMYLIGQLPLLFKFVSGKCGSFRISQ